jgi:hypothetical protein
LALKLKFNVFMAGDHDRQDVSVLVNDVPLAHWHFRASLDSNPVTRELKIPADILRSRYLEMKFRIEKPTSPAQVGVGADDRRLGIGLMRMQIGSD